MPANATRGGSAAEQPPAQLAEAIESYLTEHSEAIVLEDGQTLFDLRAARYSLSLAHGRCLLQFWSEERNLVRTIVAAQLRAGCLRLTTRRMGASKSGSLELVAQKDRRTPSVRESERRQYQRLLERVLPRHFPDWTPDGFRSAADLEHSFGPAYVRGQLLQGSRGMTAEAVIGVNSAESKATVDGVLTIGLLWLDYCRSHSVGKSARQRHYGALRVVVPAGMEQTTAARMRWLYPCIAAWRLYTLDENSEELCAVEIAEDGNQSLHLTHAFDVRAALQRAQPGVERVLALVPPGGAARVEQRAVAVSEVALLLDGLEFARVRQQASAASFAQQMEITFGAGVNETPLNEETESLCRSLLERLFAVRHPNGTVKDALFRLRTEGWLESRIRNGIAEFLPALREEFVYSQVPAMASGDRGMMDLLAVDRAGRLVIIEVKADEDLHLPLQALDYWMRVRALHADRSPHPATGRTLNAFQRSGYFAGLELANAPPRLLMVAPALRIHPANEVIVRYLVPEVDWELIAVGEDWRTALKAVFRKRRG